MLELKVILESCSYISCLKITELHNRLCIYFFFELYFKLSISVLDMKEEAAMYLQTQNKDTQFIAGL